MRAVRTVASPGRVALACILAAGLALRLWNIDHGLPFLYHADEAYHFTTRAVRMFTGGLDPGYFQNPSAFTYLVYATLRVVEGGGWPFGYYGEFLQSFRADPTSAFVAARVVATVLCLLGVTATYAAGRRLWGTAEAVAAAAVLAFAFLTVAYSRFAVTDVGVLLPIAVATLAIVRVHEGGGRRWYVIGGAATGLAIGFKYTAGLVLVPLLVAAALRARREGAREPVRDTAWALAVMAAVFALTTPFFVLDLHNALYQLKVQRIAAGTPKLGQPSDVGPLAYYVRSLTWGLGWLPLLAAAAGFVVELRRNRSRALLLALFPALLLAYFSTDADRFFARWLLPAYPILALFAGVALAAAARALTRRPALQAAALAALLAAVLAGPVIDDIRNARVLGREDTRELARTELARMLPAGARIVLEPAVPAGFFDHRYRVRFRARPRRDGLDAGGPTRFIAALGPRRIDRYRRAGACHVVTLSLIRDRALQGGDPAVRAYYRRLDRESRVVWRASPYRSGAAPVRFDFDFSTHLYYPRAYERPGPVVEVRRLDRCRQRVDPRVRAVAQRRPAA